MPVHYSAMGDREGAEGATVTGGGGSQGGRRTRRNGREAVVGGVAAAVTTMVRMTLELGGTKQQPTP